MTSVPGAETAYFEDLYEHNGKLYFRYSSPATGSEIGEFDPANGFATVIDVLPGPSSSSVAEFTSFEGNLFFTASDVGVDGIVGSELFGILANPLAANDAAVTTEDASVDVDVLANDTDPNEDDVSLLGFTQPTSGEVVTAGPGTLRYTPHPDFFGNDSFTYTVDDGNGNQATASVHVTVRPVNDAPAFTSLAIPPVEEDSGTHTIASWAAFDPGTANESDQSVLTYTVSAASSPELFASVPFISPDGTLSAHRRAECLRIQYF